MRRRIPLVASAAVGLMAAAGCQGPGWYRAIGHFPGVAASDYAFYNFNGTSSQLFQFPPAQVEMSTIEAMADLGFTLERPPIHDRGGEVRICARAPDGRPVKLALSPQGGMTNLRVTFGPLCAGDESLSRDLIRRVGLNFGTLPRDYTPMEPVLARRINTSPGVPPRIESAPPPPLEGEGLRPEAGAPEEVSPAAGLAPPGIPPIINNVPGNFLPARESPNSTGMPYAPFPYTPVE